MIAHIRKMAVERKQWLDDPTFRSGVSLCQMLPGATAMQTAAYIGLHMRGIGGAAASFIGFGLPAFLIMTVLSASYLQVQALPAVASIFSGLQAMVVAIVAHAAFTFGKTWVREGRGVLIALTAAVMFGFGIHPMLAILTAGLAGLGLYARRTFANAGADASEKPYSLKPFWLVLLFTLLALALMFLFQRCLFELAFLMFRIDLFAFGGGFSSLPLMFNEVVHVRAWMDSLTFLDGIALGQITPGPIVITATFIGYFRAGLTGGLIATVFIFLPSFLLLVGTVPYYKRLRSSPHFNRALQGILYSFVGLLLSVTIRFALDVPWDLPRMFLTGMTFTALLFRAPLHWTVLIGTIVSLLVL